LPPGVTCSPLTINETIANAPVAGLLTINVAPPSSTMTASIVPADRIYASLVPTHLTRPEKWWPLSGGTGLAVLLLLLLPLPRKYFRMTLGLALLCILCITLSCGGGGGGGGGGVGTQPVATITQLTVSSTKVPSKGTITMSAIVTGGMPTGSVQFVVDGANLGSLAPLTNGMTGNITVTAANAPAFLPIVGTHTISAHYQGTATTQASQSGTLNVAVTGTTSFLITGTADGTAANGSINLTIN
jgi:Big-like domain-containing protein